VADSKNKAVIRKFVDEVLVGGNLSLVEEVFDPGYVAHDPSNPWRQGGLEGARAFLGEFHKGLSDRAYIVEDMIEEGDLVMYRWTMRGRQTGPFMGIPPTGRSIEITGMDAFRLRNGKIVESWVAADALKMLQQLGILPPLGAPGQ